MSDLFKPPVKLKAITINGAIVVESEDDLKKREARRKQRKSRWGESQSSFPSPVPESSKTLPNLQSGSRIIRDNPKAQAEIRQQQMMLQPSLDATKMDEKSQKIYVLNLEIQEATRNLAKPDLGIPADPKERSPSPEPVYNNQGVRINTRIERRRAKLISQRNNAIAQLKDLDPTYQPPAQFRYKNTNLEDRVIIPAEEYPHINFMGLILGPRGHYLEELKKETNCNIIIRGKGSLRSGMTGITKTGKMYEGLDDPLHAYITGQSAEDVQNAAKKIQELIELHIYNPDSEKAVALRARHLHELAVLNGTLKEIDMKCLNCGRPGHKSWECEERPNFTSAVICSACGGVGHVTSDCRQQRPGVVFNQTKASSKPEVIDKEYDAFVADMEGTKATSYDLHVNSKADVGSSSGKCFETRTPALMLTNGSAAPGAASAYVRSQGKNAPEQVSTGAVQVVGKSIFGGNLTKMTAGYKTKMELEMEREKKKQELANRPVPLEWQVERYEQSLHKSQEKYMEQLERYCAEEKRRKQDSLNRPKNEKSFQSHPPPPPPPGSGSLDSDDLPEVIGRPLGSLRR